MNGSIFHDANIVGIEYNQLSNSLTLNSLLSNKVNKKIVFFNVYDFFLNSFSSQNILFNIINCNEDNFLLSELLNSFPSLSLDVINYSKLNNLNIYIIEPSVGLSGYIIAKSLNVID